MKNHFSRAFLILLPLLPACVPAFAQEPDQAQVVGGPQFADWQKGRWELGVDFGMMYPTRKRLFSHLIDNQRAYDLLANESVGDEVAEGWIAPPLPGNSTISGRLSQIPDVGIHAFYRETPWLAGGLDFGYGLKRDMRVESKGIYVPSNFMNVAYSGNIVHLSALAKVGPALGSFRPYAIGGPGLYLIQEHAEIMFDDGDDPQLQPLPVVNKNLFYSGLSAGGGFEWRVESGLVGVELAYHHVFMPGTALDYFEPKLRFAVLF